MSDCHNWTGTDRAQFFEKSRYDHDMTTILANIDVILKSSLNADQQRKQLKEVTAKT